MNLSRCRCTHNRTLMFSEFRNDWLHLYRNIDKLVWRIKSSHTVCLCEGEFHFRAHVPSAVRVGLLWQHCTTEETYRSSTCVPLYLNTCFLRSVFSKHKHEHLSMTMSGTLIWWFDTGLWFVGYWPIRISLFLSLILIFLLFKCHLLIFLWKYVLLWSLLVETNIIAPSGNTVALLIYQNMAVFVWESSPPDTGTLTQPMVLVWGGTFCLFYQWQTASVQETQNTP